MTVNLEKKLAELCKEKGMRLTGQRRVILQVLSDSADHPDAEELHRRVSKVAPGISIATVYRTVSTLESCGLIERHSFADGRARYETSGSEHHDHFINVETDEVIEFRCDEIEQLQDRIAREHGFEIVGHRLEIYVRPRDDKNGGK
ncbi:Fur family transcriptional regulator [Paracoccus sp. AS002]|uniref:Fur family transcriptional regulator n=1 Tax=Paracoccus sp. AS002 TaxID=3019545 RepID=UPI000911580B|nr:Fur family transcriptional regulator [Paracoccus sp. AS002]MDF3905938.1 Fur family transcriptional regulator [Paracoccus sp. AS002]SFY32063.1 Fur family transcriptional regulator, ferric uptake regulator [Paracoccus pantotrophus]